MTKATPPQSGLISFIALYFILSPLLLFVPSKVLIPLSHYLSILALLSALTVNPYIFFLRSRMMFVKVIQRDVQS